MWNRYYMLELFLYVDHVTFGFYVYYGSLLDVYQSVHLIVYKCTYVLGKRVVTPGTLRLKDIPITKVTIVLRCYEYSLLCLLLKLFSARNDIAELSKIIVFKNL